MVNWIKSKFIFYQNANFPDHFGTPVILKPSEDSNHNPKKCKKYFPVKKVCFKEYERLKKEAKTCNDFCFSKRFREILQILQAENVPQEVAEYFQSEETARVICSSIRSSNHQVILSQQAT